MRLSATVIVELPWLIRPRSPPQRRPTCDDRRSYVRPTAHRPRYCSLQPRARGTAAPAPTTVARLAIAASAVTVKRVLFDWDTRCCSSPRTVLEMGAAFLEPRGHADEQGTVRPFCAGLLLLRDVVAQTIAQGTELHPTRRTRHRGRRVLRIGCPYTFALGGAIRTGGRSIRPYRSGAGSGSCGGGGPCQSQQGSPSSAYAPTRMTSRPRGPGSGESRAPSPRSRRAGSSRASAPGCITLALVARCDGA